jgi:hypothetical protein
MILFKHTAVISTSIGLLLCLHSCKGGYSFTGISLSPEVKSVSISYINNMASIVYPPLSNSFTEALKDKFTRTTRLDLINEEGDLEFEGEITNYEVTSIGVQANEVAATNRLSITVKIRFTNHTDEKQSYDKSFSAYEDFPSSQTLDAVQSQLAEEIIKKLVEDIFNTAVANW